MRGERVTRATACNVQKYEYEAENKRRGDKRSIHFSGSLDALGDFKPSRLAISVDVHIGDSLVYFIQSSCFDHNLHQT